MRRHGERGHFTGAVLGVGIQGRATKNDAIMVDDAVVADVAFYFCAFTSHQCAVLLERFNELQHTTQIVRVGFTQALQSLVHHHGANAVVHINFEQQHAIYGEGQDVAAFHTRFTSLHAVLQIKTGVGGLGGRGLFGQ